MKNSVAFFALIASSLSCLVSAPVKAGNSTFWTDNNAVFQITSRGLMPGPTTSNGRMSLMQMSSNLVPLGQVFATINSQEPGRQLDTNTVMDNGRPIYVVRWQASRGRIIIFRVDAESGQIIGRQG